MFLETIESEGLAHKSYLVGDGTRAAVIDPRRDCEVYVERASARGARITHIFETHRNEDYAVGSLDLARRTGAEILHGHALDFEYGKPVREGDRFELGGVRLEILETPGHTPESISIVLVDTGTSEDPVGVFTGDCLFVGDVGRTDLLGEDRERDQAEALYDSIFGKLVPLGDEVSIFPAHGAGSVCGGGMADRNVSTLGYERRHNPALQVEGQEEFVERKLAEKHNQPPYFRRMERYNRSGAPRLDRLPTPEAMAVTAFADRMDDLQVVDIRSPEAYCGASIPGSLCLPLGMIPSYAGWFLDYERDIGLVSDDPGKLEAAVRHLVRLGFDRVTCHLADGVHAWTKSGQRFQHFPTLHAEDVERRLAREELLLVDVRKRSEWETARIPQAIQVFLGKLPDHLERIPRDRPVATFCGSGRRATVAASVLRRRGFGDVQVWLGSMASAQALGSSFIEKS